MLDFTIFILLPLFASFLCYIVKNIKIHFFISFFVAIFHLVLSLLVFNKLYHTILPTYFGIDSISRFFILILSNVYFWVVIVSYNYLKRPYSEKVEESKKYYFLLLNFYLASNSAAMLSNHFGMYWVASEATTLSVAPLIYYYRNEESLEAMWKYMFTVSIGIAFAFIGILFLSLASKNILYDGRQLFYWELIKNASKLNTIWLKASFIFIFVGLSTKIGIAPMHSGDVDATSNAPSPIAALMSGSLRLTALLGVLRIFQIVTFSSTYSFAKSIMIIGSLLSLFVAFAYMFKASNYKRLLAYSSVEHLGIITLGIATGGLAFVGALYHSLYNSINKIVLFLMAGNIHYKYKSREIESVKSVFKNLPITGWLFLISVLAILGIPPFGIFFSEIKIFEGLIISNQWFILVAIMFFLLFIFVNMSKKVFEILFKEDDLFSNNYVKKEKFELIHLISIMLLIMLAVIPLSFSNIIYQNILSILNDFGMKI